MLTVWERRSELCPSTPGQELGLGAAPSAGRAGLTPAPSSAARCAAPDVVLDTPLLDFQRCFLNQPCEKKVRLTNAGNVPACYGVLDQVRNTPSDTAESS